MIITIDGPTASGKSTTACALACTLEYNYLNSGLLYRAAAYLSLYVAQLPEEQLMHLNTTQVQELLDPKFIVYCYTKTCGARIIYNSSDITAKLKDSLIDRRASIISVNPEVRYVINSYQRAYARSCNIVADGRDAGSCVFPDADHKFFLTASLEVRASRWLKDQLLRGHVFSLQESTDFIAQRDERDSTRAIAPLVPAQGAIIIDSTDMSFDQVLTTINNYIKK